ncbi:MAG: hypothetical protein M5U28_52940 [Sandaracinaceae bacterium]|nr:hypothetical protein [Sandaracinaceae bacterium]
MDEVARAGHSHYNQELRGGEGHMEVAKLILNVVHQKTHMTLSVKPFGCMPSSGVSDGVQSVVTERYPDAIFCAVETSGDGAVNFYSRVQMFLFKARQRALAEYEETLARYGVTEEQVRAFVAGTRYAHPFYKAPHTVAGTGADLVHHVAPLIGKGPFGRAKVHGARALASAKHLATETLPGVASTLREVGPYLPALVRWVGNEAKDAMPGPKELYQRVLGSLVRPTEGGAGRDPSRGGRAARAPGGAAARAGDGGVASRDGLTGSRSLVRRLLACSLACLRCRALACGPALAASYACAVLHGERCRLLDDGGRGLPRRDVCVRHRALRQRKRTAVFFDAERGKCPPRHRFRGIPPRLPLVVSVNLLLLVQGTARAHTARARHASCRCAASPFRRALSPPGRP